MQRWSTLMTRQTASDGLRFVSLNDPSASTECGHDSGPSATFRIRGEWQSTRCVRPRLALAALSALFITVVVPTSPVAAQRRGFVTVIDAYESARNRGDMDAAVALFADDAVVIDSAGATHRGRQQIRLLLQPGANPDWAAEVTDRTTSDDIVVWTERVGVHGTARSLRVAANVRGGAIMALAYGGRDMLPYDTSNAVTAPVLPAAYGLAGVLFALLGSLGVVAVSTPHPADTALRGSLFAHLQRWSRSRSKWQPEGGDPDRSEPV